jgi:ankyrin repeat protein
VLASIKGKNAIVKELLAHGADPNVEDSVHIYFSLFDTKL